MVDVMTALPSCGRLRREGRVQGPCPPLSFTFHVTIVMSSSYLAAKSALASRPLVIVAVQTI